MLLSGATFAWAGPMSREDRGDIVDCLCIIHFTSQCVAVTYFGYY